MVDRSEQKNQVMELCKQNLTQTEIAKRVGVSITTVRRWIKETGTKNKVGVSQSNLIKRMYEEGKGSIQIAMDLGLTRTYVLAVLKDKNIKTDEETVKKNTDDEENRLVNRTLEKMMIDGVMYEDVMPLIFAEG